MKDIAILVNLLENRYKEFAFGDEKGYILNLLQLYYPILQRSMTKTVEIKESKLNLYQLENDCMHKELIKVHNTKYLYKCAECGKVIIK